MKILITGAYGQLGSELKLLSTDYPNWEFLFTDADSLDITDKYAIQSFFNQHHPDFVINCAAYTAVDKAETDNQTAENINALAPKLLAWASNNTAAKLIHISTDYVFDGCGFQPYIETDVVNPVSVYGKSKLSGEINALTANPSTVVIRTSWLYSAFGNNFVKTMRRLGRERDELSVVFDQIGTPTNAADLANVIYIIIAAAEMNTEDFIPGIYHFSNEGVASWYDFAKAVFEFSDIKTTVNPVRSVQFPTPAKRPGYSVLDKQKIKTTFGIEIPYWKDSLKICIEKMKS